MTQEEEDQSISREGNSDNDSRNSGDDSSPPMTLNSNKNHSTPQEEQEVNSVDASSKFILGERRLIWHNSRDFDSKTENEKPG